MTDLDTPPTETRPLRAVVRFWPMSFALAFVGLVAGIGVGAGKPPIYTAETRLAIGAQGLSSYAIPGFALAAQELAADYARYVSLAQDGSALTAALGSRSAEIVGLSASPVPNSSVVSVEAQSRDSALAIRAAARSGPHSSARRTFKQTTRPRRIAQAIHHPERPGRPSKSGAHRAQTLLSKLLTLTDRDAHPNRLRPDRGGRRGNELRRTSAATDRTRQPVPVRRHVDHAVEQPQRRAAGHSHLQQHDEERGTIRPRRSGRRRSNFRCSRRRFARASSNDVEPAGARSPATPTRRARSRATWPTLWPIQRARAACLRPLTHSRSPYL